MRMRARFPAPLRSGLLFAATLTACVGHPLGTTASGSSPSPVPDVFDCVKAQLKSLGYSQTSIDAAEYRITAKKNDETVRRPDVTFRRVVHRLEIQVAPGAAGSVTTVEVDANTFAEMTTQRGPTEVQERTSPDAETAAQTIVQECGK